MRRSRRDIVPSPELALVLACCRWPGGAARDAAVCAAAIGVDWALVETLVARHRVAPLVFAALIAAQARMPMAVRQSMMRQEPGFRQLDQMLSRESVRLQAAFDADGIAAPIVKGAPLAMLAYGTQGLKIAKDVDFLVAPAKVAAAIRLLEREGYKLQKPAVTLDARQLGDVMRYDREIGLVHRDHSQLQIDLHWALSRNPHVLPGMDADAPTQIVDLREGRVRTLRDDDLFAYLCAHGASHGWFRLKWLVDVAAFAAGRDVTALYRAADARRVGDAAGQALLLAHDLLGLDLPAGLATALRARPRVRRLVRAALDLIAGQGAAAEIAQRRFGRVKLQYAEMLLMRDPTDLRATLRHYLVPIGDVLAVPLPRGLHILYPLLRIPMGVVRILRR